MSPHDPLDHWAMGGEGERGTLGRCVLHIVPTGCDFVENALSFVAYLTSNPDAHAAYAKVKLEGARLAIAAGDEAEGGSDTEKRDRHKEYKMHKQGTVTKLLEEAKAWSKSNREEGNAA